MLLEWRFTMSYKRGDVVLLLFPHSNLLTAKRRPALIVQSDDIDTGIPQKIVAMITSNIPVSYTHLTLPTSDLV